MSEQVYDDEIAPVLRKLARLCEEHGMSMTALVEFGRPDECGLTLALQTGAGPSIRIAAMAAKAYGNVDALIMGLLNDAEKYGHSSAYMQLLLAREVTP